MSASLQLTKEQCVKALIEQRRRQIMVHSYIYYELNTNVISDEKWSLWAEELKELQDNFPEISNNAFYAREFEDFNPSSGYYLDYKQAWVEQTALKLLKLLKGK